MACPECEALQHRLGRRSLLRSGGTVLMALGVVGPLAIWQGGRGRIVEAAELRGGASAGRILVVVQLAGGNDGLNTVVPAGQGAYYDARPTIAVPQSQVLPLADGLGLHPSLKDIQRIHARGQLAIVQGAGYPNPNRSHFVSMRIWQTADPTGLATTGWVGRFLDSLPTPGPLAAVALGPQTPPELLGATVRPVAIEAVDGLDLLPGRQVHDQALATALRRMYGDLQGAGLPTFALVRGTAEQVYSAASLLAQAASSPYRPSAAYPPGRFGRDLQLVARLIAGELPTRVYHVTLGGFDDHANEHQAYANLLGTLSSGVGAFLADLEARGLADRVLLLTWSEFGRRVKENASGGTDHGTAGPLFAAGGRVRGGTYGEPPSVTDLDANGDLKFDTDFRQVYATVLDRWLGGDPERVLGGTYQSLKFLG